MVQKRFRLNKTRALTFDKQRGVMLWKNCQGCLSVLACV